MTGAGDVGLVASATLMGLAGAPHCVAMCGAACAAAGGRGAGRWLFHGARIASYAVAGAVAAGGVGALAAAGQAVAALRPLWTLLHVAALGLGAFLLWRGRPPAWLERQAPGHAVLDAVRTAPAATVSATATATAGWQPLAWHAAAPRRVGAGLAWAAWPCGLLHSALVVAALAGGPLPGAAAMAGFAAASAAPLVAGPALWWRLAGRGGSPAVAVRLAGATLAAASAWALGHGLWTRAAGWCLG